MWVTGAVNDTFWGGRKAYKWIAHLSLGAREGFLSEAFHIRVAQSSAIRLSSLWGIESYSRQPMLFLSEAVLSQHLIRDFDHS